ncbi:MAG: hypothetical protein V2I74_06835 [Erythrobacter sp.]|nr:hypothetical protein [Erythrobacter sp.]
MVTGNGVYMLARRKFHLLLPLSAGLCACAGGDGPYPSLATRAFESAAAPVASAPAEPIRPLADAAALRALVARAAEADNGFTREATLAEPLVRRASGQPVESDTRAAALVAMADLAARRGAASAVLAELDRLVAESATTFAPAEDIKTARGTVEALVSGQNATMARLWEELGQ